VDEPQEPSERVFWESEAPHWIAWARTPGHDAYWDYSPMFFRDIVPSPTGRTLEIGCGEGRVTRDLQRLGHDVTAIDAAPSLLLAAHEVDPGGRYVLGDGARHPFADSTFDVVVAYNSLMDMDDMPRTVREAARVLRPGGRMCICVTHPMVDVGSFERREADAPFVIDGDYLSTGVFDETFEHSGLVMRFRSITRPIESYSMALEAAGLLIERLREPAQREDVVASDPAEARWQRLPNFLFVAALKPALEPADRRVVARTVAEEPG
jgi:SAM-dependent methyltransferase